jgi:hypothetical protein
MAAEHLKETFGIHRRSCHGAKSGWLGLAALRKFVTQNEAYTSHLNLLGRVVGMVCGNPLSAGAVWVAQIVPAHRSRVLVEVLHLAEALRYRPLPLAMFPLSRSAVAPKAGTSTANGVADKAGSL